MCSDSMAAGDGRHFCAPNKGEDLTDAAHRQSCYERAIAAVRARR